MKIINLCKQAPKILIDVVVQNPTVAGTIGGIAVIVGGGILIKKKFFKPNVTNETIADSDDKLKNSAESTDSTESTESTDLTESTDSTEVDTSSDSKDKPENPEDKTEDQDFQ